MDYRKINSHIILLLMVIVVGLVVAMIVRVVVMDKGADVGTANIAFLIILGICAVIYFIIIASLSHTIIPWITRKLPQREIPTPAENTSLMDIGKIKQDVDLQYLERLKVKINLFLEYAHIVMGPYITKDELSRLDRYIEYYAKEEAIPDDLIPIKPEKLKNPDLFHFGWNMAEYFGIGKKKDVLFWLKRVFSSLAELEDSYVIGKLFDGHTKKYIIPNTDDISKFLVNLKG